MLNPAYKQYLQNAHVYVKSIFPSPFQFTDQNMGASTYAKKEGILIIPSSKYAILHQ